MRNSLTYDKHMIVIDVTNYNEVVFANDELLIPNIDRATFNPHYIISQTGGVVELAPPEVPLRYIDITNANNNIDGFYRTKKRSWLLDSEAVVIQLVNLGPIIPTKMGMRSFNGIKVDNYYEFDTPFRGASCFEKYTSMQLKTLDELIIYIREYFNNYVDFYYREDAWVFAHSIIEFPQGIITPYSFRNDLCTIAPQPDLIKTLKNI